MTRPENMTVWMTMGRHRYSTNPRDPDHYFVGWRIVDAAEAARMLIERGWPVRLFDLPPEA